MEFLILDFEGHSNMYNIASELTLIFHLMQQDTNQRDDDKTLIGFPIRDETFW